MVQPLFIGGLGRSGTTLLADMMGFHPSLSPIYETDFVVSLLKLTAQGGPREVLEARVWALLDQWSADLPYRPDDKRCYEAYAHGPHHLQFTRDDVLQQVPELFRRIRREPTRALERFLTTIFAAHCRADGKPRWINKTPAYIHCLGTLRQVFPTMKFVHVIRDGRDVAASVMTREWGPASAASAATHWRDGLAKGAAFGRSWPHQLLEIRFEDLLSHPAATLDRVLTFVGLGGSHELVSSYVEQLGALDASRVGTFRTALSAAEIETFETLAGGCLERAGYMTHRPGVRCPQAQARRVGASCQTNERLNAPNLLA